MFRTVAAIAAVLTAAPAVASAEPLPDEARCIAEYESGQRARLDGDLIAARRSFTICAQSSCPAIAQTDCGEWMRELDQRIPTLTVTAQSSDGKDLTSAHLLIDGQLISQTLDGKPIAVNPGRHRVVIQTRDGRVEQTVVANEGEKARLLRLVLRRDGAEVEPSDGPTVLEALPWVLAGVSVVAFGAFTYLAVDGTSDLQELRDTCAPTCPEGSLDSVKRQLLFADIMLVLGGVSAASSVTLFIVGASSSSAPEAALLTFSGQF